MGFQIDADGIKEFIASLSEYDVYAPVIFKDGGIYSDTNMIRYKKINDIKDVEFNDKSDFSFKEVLLPIMQTIFYFNEDQIREPNQTARKAIVLLRHCDMHAVKRLDTMYLMNGPEDSYYKQTRDKIKFVVMGCQDSFDNCFCVSMGSNISNNYNFSLDFRDGLYYIDCKDDEFSSLLSKYAIKEVEVVSDHVVENDIKVNIPDNLSAKVATSTMWDEYDTRCIACGRCNFVCPTCTCNTMQDIFYQDNGRVGERRRVWASCMVDGYTEVAGNHSFRDKNGERMRFKVLHKVLDYRQRFGENMCIGCGRCDDVCPQYISFSNSINKLEAALKEVNEDGK